LLIDEEKYQALVKSLCYDGSVWTTHKMV